MMLCPWNLFSRVDSVDLSSTDEMVALLHLSEMYVVVGETVCSYGTYMRSSMIVTPHYTVERWCCVVRRLINNVNHTFLCLRPSLIIRENYPVRSKGNYAWVISWYKRRRVVVYNVSLSHYDWITSMRCFTRRRLSLEWKTYVYSLAPAVDILVLVVGRTLVIWGRQPRWKRDMKIGTLV